MCMSKSVPNIRIIESHNLIFRSVCNPSSHSLGQSIIQLWRSSCIISHFIHVVSTEHLLDFLVSCHDPYGCPKCIYYLFCVLWALPYFSLRGIFCTGSLLILMFVTFIYSRSPANNLYSRERLWPSHSTSGHSDYFQLSPLIILLNIFWYTYASWFLRHL